MTWFVRPDSDARPNTLRGSLPLRGAVPIHDVVADYERRPMRQSQAKCVIIPLGRRKADASMTSWLLPEVPLFLLTAIATHLVMSFAQTVMHYKLESSAGCGSCRK